jgi:hypothetical protein
MAIFPELKPTSRSYDFGLFPLTEQASISAGIVRFRHSTVPQNYSLTLSYNGLTDAKASLIRTHFQGQSGTYRSFSLPSIVWEGHTFSGNVMPYDTLWRYLDAPEEEHLSLGYVNLTVNLGSDGSIAMRPADTVAASLTAGVATGA